MSEMSNVELRAPEESCRSSNCTQMLSETQCETGERQGNKTRKEEDCLKSALMGKIKTAKKPMNAKSGLNVPFIKPLCFVFVSFVIFFKRSTWA